ncbi:peptidylprolyl isomerase [Kangiella aquimarina]|uniref:Chaperone SurA n=1 Tax=Kangiella aquimarina TaxID=261965 RepID=A0ABZ0X692_9GAMM|nr:peptidylprolyl isomerase [Kangiella aquimarina]WQG86035.1 peptidylprolyl isomerase [Kangiella aquimarina]
MILKKALVGFTLCLAAFSLQAEVIDKVIAHVDEDVILQSELDRKIVQAKQQIRSRGGQLPPEDVLRKELLEQLIIQNLQYQIALRSGMQIQPAELQQYANQVAKNSGMSLEEFRLSLAQQGISYELFLNDLRKEILTGQLRDALVARRIKISDKEIDSLIQSMNAQNQVEYNLGHILIAVPENADEQTESQAKQKALSVIKELKAGADFAETAKAVSSSPDAAEGGDFGWRTESTMPTLFANVVSFLRKGEVSQPIRSPSGFHVLKIKDKRGDQQHLVQQTNARHILIRPDAITTEADAKQQLSNIRQRVLAGDADFAEEAKKHSDDPGSAKLGGDLGWNNLGVYDPVFEQTLANLEVNEISEPFQSSFGWHIVQLLGRRTDDQTDAMKRQQALRILQQRKFGEEVENWIRELRDEAYVKKIVEEDA